MNDKDLELEELSLNCTPRSGFSFDADLAAWIADHVADHIIDFLNHPDFCVILLSGCI